MSNHYYSEWYPHLIPIKWDKDTVTVLNCGGVRSTNMEPCKCKNVHDHAKIQYIIHSSKRYNFCMKACSCFYNITKETFTRKELNDMLNFSEECTNCCTQLDIKKDGLIKFVK